MVLTRGVGEGGGRRGERKEEMEVEGEERRVGSGGGQDERRNGRGSLAKG